MSCGERIGVIGAGVSGLTAAYLLARSHDVVLFEADERLGGHAHTHELTTTDGRPVAVDSGFIVHNTRTYPTLRRLFTELGVATQETEMSMSVRCDECGLQYAGARGLAGLFPSLRNPRNARYLRMLSQVRRFHREANRLLDRVDAAADAVTLGQFLAAGQYSRYFVQHFAVPLVSAVWSASGQLSLRYPARYLFTFLRRHGMLSVTGAPSWRSVVGGSREYVDRLAKHLPVVRTAAPVRTVERRAAGVDVRGADDTVHHFDRVVIASHADQALAMLAQSTDAQRRVLGAFTYSENPTLLHTDPSPLPTASRARASWNYRKPHCDTGQQGVRISYDMNKLMRLDTDTPYVVTLNDPGSIPDERVLARMRYRHPIYTPESVAAQRDLADIEEPRIRFAGAYRGWGFHEDGCASGARAAGAFGCGW